MNHKKIWVVSYYNIEQDPVVTVFDNKDNAMKCYSYFLGNYDRVNIDECPIYSTFVFAAT